VCTVSLQAAVHPRLMPRAVVEKKKEEEEEEEEEEEDISNLQLVSKRMLHFFGNADFFFQFCMKFYGQVFIRKLLDSVFTKFK
jgi:hypothetical protein